MKSAHRFDLLHVFKALGEENRLRIVQLLLNRRCSVNEIAENLKITPANVSCHLRVLRNAGFLEQKKSGLKRVYSLAPVLGANEGREDETLDLGCCTIQFDKMVGHA